MPPSVVKTIRDLIYWEYAKLISGSATGDRKNFGFVMRTFTKLRDGSLTFSSVTKENKVLCKNDNCCAYCECTEGLEWDHVIPRCKLLIDTLDNQVMACRTCNAQKSGRDPFEWYGRDRMYEIPRMVLGKYLKLIYEIHERQGTLDRTDLDGDGELNIYDLGCISCKE